MPGIGCGCAAEGSLSLMALLIAAVSLPRSVSKTRKVRTESSMEPPAACCVPEGAVSAVLSPSAATVPSMVAEGEDDAAVFNTLGLSAFPTGRSGA